MRCLQTVSVSIVYALQVTQDVCEILEPRGYVLECRGHVKVKGKGDMLIYLLHDKKPLPAFTSSSSSAAAAAATGTVNC